jgi:hypothetical protein
MILTLRIWACKALDNMKIKKSNDFKKAVKIQIANEHPGRSANCYPIGKVFISICSIRLIAVFSRYVMFCSLIVISTGFSYQINERK